MGLDELKCNNCGGKLKLDESGQLVCPQCGSLYAETEENNDYITNHNETTVNNYYGTATKDATCKNQIEGFFELFSDAFVNGYYNEAFSYCNKILNYDSTNNEALLLKRYLNENRVSARKFYKHSLYQIILNVIDHDFLGDRPESRRHLIHLIDKLIDKFFNILDLGIDIGIEYNFASISILKEYIDNKKCDDSEFLELQEKNNRAYLQFGNILLGKKEKEVQLKLKQKFGLILSLFVSALFCTIVYLMGVFIQLDSYKSYDDYRFADRINEYTLKGTWGIILCVLEIIVIIVSIVIYKRKKVNIK